MQTLFRLFNEARGRKTKQKNKSDEKKIGKQRIKEEKIQCNNNRSKVQEVKERVEE